MRVKNICHRLRDALHPILTKVLNVMTAHFWETVTIGTFLLAFLLYDLTGWLVFGILLLTSGLFLMRLMFRLNADSPAAQRIMGTYKSHKTQKRHTTSYMVIHLFSDNPNPDGDGIKQAEQLAMDDRVDFADQMPLRLRPDYRYVHQFLLVGDDTLYVAGYENTQYDELAAHRRGDGCDQ